MIDLDSIVKEGYEKGASDVHLICGLNPILRIKRDLIYMTELKVLTKEDMLEILDYVLKENEERKKLYNEIKQVDLNMEFNDIRVRLNISKADDSPLFTMRIIKDVLPRFEELGLPDVIRRTALLPQGLILVTGKPNTGKSTTLNTLVDYINENENKKILMLENPIEYKHKQKKSIIIQKEIGPGKDCLRFSDGAKNALREDCDILVIGEIRDKDTMDAAINMAESGHMVIGTLHTKSCAETIDRIINFYDTRDQLGVKYLMSTLLKVVVSQRLIKGTNMEKLTMVPEIMIVDSIISAMIRKEKFNVSEIEDAIQMGFDKGNLSLMNSLAELVINNKLTMEQAMGELDENSYEILIRTIRQLKLKYGIL